MHDGTDGHTGKEHDDDGHDDKEHHKDDKR